MKKILIFLLAFMMLFVCCPVQATPLSVQNPINFTGPPLGDSVSTAFGKIIAEEAAIYLNLNNIQQCYISTSAPSSPNAGMLWANTTNAATTGTVLEMRDYLNANWIPLFVVTANSIVSVPTPATGDVPYFNTSSVWSVLAPGTAGQSLITGGATANPFWGGGINFSSLSGYKAQVTSNTAVSISVNNNPFGTGTLSLTLNTGTSGANGLDTGSIGDTAWYYTYICYGSSGVCGLMSLSSTSPTLPAGYNLIAFRIGAVRTDASGYLMRTIQYGRKVQYVITASTNTSSFPLMASGTAGSPSTPTWIAVATGTFVPPTASKISIIGSENGTATSYLVVAPNNSYGASNSTTNPPPFNIMTNSAFAITGSITFSLESTNIYWASSNSASYLFCYGWEDNL